MADVRLGEEAEAEYTAALQWYYERSKRAAERFEEAFSEAVEKVGRTPDRYPTCDEEGFRFCMLNRYPYSLIYRVVGGDVQVIAVAHARRKPGYWSQRQ